MGAERAVIARQGAPGYMVVRNFTDTIVAKLELEGDGEWLLFGRVSVSNRDGDPQNANAKLVYRANTTIDEGMVRIDEAPGSGDGIVQVLYVQGALAAEARETVTLECSTYFGTAMNGSLIALKVDKVEYQ